MLSEISAVIPTSLTDFSKSVTKAISSQLHLTKTAKSDPKKRDSGKQQEHTQPDIDADAILSYYARLGEHRPCSRLLRERMFEHRNKGPRSAKLLVSGSPTFERPWRTPDYALRSDAGVSKARKYHRNARPAPNFDTDTRPKTASVLMGERDVKYSNKSRRSQNSSVSKQWQQQEQQQQQFQQSGMDEVTRILSWDTSGKNNNHSPRSASQTNLGSTSAMTPLPLLQRNEAEAAIAMTSDDVDAQRSAISITEQSVCAKIVGGEGSRINTVLRETADDILSKRPSTAPSAVSDSRVSVSRLPSNLMVEEERGQDVQGVLVTPTTGESPETISDGSLYMRGLEDYAVSDEVRPGITFALTTPAGENVNRDTPEGFDVDLSCLSSINLRPATAERDRRLSVETAATFSRSSRLPQPTCSLSSSSTIGLNDSHASRRRVEGITASVEVDNQTNRSTRRVSRRPTRPPDMSRRATTSPKRRRPRRQRGGGRNGALRNRRHDQGRCSSAPGSLHTDGDGFPAPTASLSAALVRAASTTWTHWRRPGDLGELDVQADQTYSMRETATATGKNGAVTGAGWGGNDQIARVAAARRFSTSIGRDQTDQRRPDSRERFYEAPVPVLKAFRPCVRCFDILMRYFRDGVDADTIVRQISWASTEALCDPHVAFFVRWESKDERLDRFIPRGFVGSFTPRPFRPTLDEYAVKAAQDPKFWGLGWAQIPRTRCAVIVVKSLEVAAHDMDWIWNRHGLALSFQDAAERHYQSVIFPETIFKAGWNKEDTIDALYRKAGYWKPRTKRSHTRRSSSMTASSKEGKTEAKPSAIDHDSVVSSTAVFCRFETVTFRLDFSTYQRAKEAASGVTPQPLRPD